MQILNMHMIDLTSMNEIGSNALHIAVKKNSVGIVKELISMSFPLDNTKANGVTALGIAAYKGNLEIIKILVNAGANVNKTSKTGIGPLNLAIKAN
jgi:ankyrin repeat protein